jgi:hypothetical protein
MNRFFAGSAVLYLASHMVGVCAQTAPAPSVDSLYDQGQHEMTANWRAFGKMHDAAVFIHKDVKKTNNGRVTVWRHYEFPFPKYLEKEMPYLSARELAIVDCKSSTVGVSEFAHYPGRFGTGAVIATNKVKSAEMAEAMPDSLEEQLIKTLCASKPRSKPVRKAKPAKAVSDDKPS